MTTNIFLSRRGSIAFDRFPLFDDTPNSIVRCFLLAFVLKLSQSSESLFIFAKIVCGSRSIARLVA